MRRMNPFLIIKTNKNISMSHNAQYGYLLTVFISNKIINPFHGFRKKEKYEATKGTTRADTFKTNY